MRKLKRKSDIKGNDKPSHRQNEEKKVRIKVKNAKKERKKEIK